MRPSERVSIVVFDNRRYFRFPAFFEGLGEDSLVGLVSYERGTLVVENQGSGLSAC